MSDPITAASTLEAQHAALAAVADRFGNATKSDPNPEPDPDPETNNPETDQE